MSDQDVQPAALTVDQSASNVILNLARILLLAALLLGLMTILACMGRWHWILELTTHFRFQYFAAATLILVCLLILRRFRWALLAASVSVINGAIVLPVFAPVQATPETTPAVRVLFVNVFIWNPNHEEVLQLVRETDPDILLFAETNRKWISALDELKNEYPYTVSDPHQGAFGFAAYSRIGLRRFEVQWIGDPPVPAVIAETELDGQPIKIVGVHVGSPGSGSSLRHRTNHMQHLAQIAADGDVPTAIIGDLNVTPWSPYFSDMLNAGNLHDTRRGFGNQGSWPARFSLLQIPIDHCLVSDDVFIKRREICHSVGSDHFPLLVELAVKRKMK